MTEQLYRTDAVLNPNPAAIAAVIILTMPTCGPAAVAQSRAEPTPAEIAPAEMARAAQACARNRVSESDGGGKQAFERHLAPHREKAEVEGRLRTMGFSCNSRDDKFDATTSVCAVNVHETFVLQRPDQPAFYLVTRITVTVQFETEQSPSARQIEVKAGRAML
jgi:hypothetical protein